MLQSFPIYQLAAIIPPYCVIRDLHKLFAIFLWSFKEYGRNKHWVSSIKIFQPKMKRGLSSDHYLMYQEFCLQNFGWILEPNTLCGQTSYGTNTVRSVDLKIVEWKGGSQFFGIWSDQRLCFQLVFCHIIFSQPYNFFNLSDIIN